MRIMFALVGFFLSLAACSADTTPVVPAAPIQSAIAAPVQKVSYIEGKDYMLIEEPVRTADPSKIEVAEVFAYTCPHCFHFQPLLDAWAKKQPADVALVQTHTKWGPQMEPYQRGFYTMVALKVKDKAQMVVFNAIHVERKELNTAQAWADLLAPLGVDKQSVLKTFDSFGVTSQINQADARTRGYKISGTPELVVEGKYRISTRSGGSQEDLLKVAQFLIEKVRAERTPK
jgi:protein dithiol oxidoreductase (disulfide-forming)